MLVEYRGMAEYNRGCFEFLLSAQASQQNKNF